MTDDITRADIRTALQSYYAVPTPPRAHNVIVHVSELLDEADVQAERNAELNQQLDSLSGSIDDLQHDLKVANAKIVELQRGLPAEPEDVPDHSALLEAYQVARDAGEHSTEDAWNEARDVCIDAIPALVAENVRLRHDSEVLRKLLDAAALFVGMVRWPER